MTDVDGLHGSFLATDENGQRLFAITSSDGSAQHAALTVIQLAGVPLGIGTISPATASASGGTNIKPFAAAAFRAPPPSPSNGKAATISFKDMNTLTVVTPSLAAGSLQLTITNPDGESVFARCCNHSELRNFSFYLSRFL